jgi:3-oxoacyl-[acyl-carrier protein] reductase
MNVKGAAVLVTGGGRGIGRHLIQRLHDDGANVAVLEYDPACCEEIESAFAGTITVRACDVTDPAAVDQAVQAIADTGFVCDVLVNNAGIIHNEMLVNPLERTNRVHSRESWRRVMAADLDSVFFVTSTVVDRMMKARRKGVVISISSIAAHGNPGQSAYSAAKAGVNALTKAWAKELGVLGFRFASVAPGFLDTASTRAALTDAVLTKHKNQIPLRRLGEPEHIYLAVRHVIENDYLSGTVLDVDGGLVL